MNSLKLLIASLSRSEVSRMRRYFSHMADKQQQKRLQLFDLIRSKNTISDSDASMLINRKLPDSGFSHLKTRLLEDITNVLILNIDERLASDVCSVKQHCRKQIIIAELLLDKGQFDAATNILNTIALLIDEYGLLTEKLLLSDVCSRMDIASSHLIEIRDASGFSDYASLLLKIRNTVQSLLFNSDFYSLSILSVKTALPDLEDLLFRLQDYSHNHNKKDYKIKFWTAILQSLLYFGRGIFNHAELQAEKSGYFIDRQPKYFSKDSIKLSLLLQAVSSLSQGKSVKTSTQLHQLIKVSSHENEGLQFRELLIKAMFRHAELEIVLQEIKNDLTKIHVGKNRFAIQKWYYMMACVSFKLKRFNVSIEMLNKSRKVQYEMSPALNLSVRLLEIMNLLESGMQDVADSKIEAAKQYLKRNKGLKEKRLRLSLRLLEKLLKANLNYRKFHESNLLLIQKLNTNSDDYFQSPLSDEMISFNHWLMSKLPAYTATKVFA